MDQDPDPSSTSEPSTSSQKSRTGLKIKHKSHTHEFKLEVLTYASQHSIHAASKKFGVSRPSIREWKKMEGKLKTEVRF